MRKENNTKKYVRVKQIISLAMIISMLLCLMQGLGIDATVVYGETNEISGTCGENLTWSFDESTGVLDITGEGEMDEFVSFTLNYDQVFYTPPWWRYRNEIKTVNISRGVTNISAGVFEGCNYLTNISIPDSVIEIETHAFCYCSRLTNIEIPNSVTSIGDSAFWLCSSITDLTIPNSVISIGDDAFACCSSITDLTIPNSVTSIGDSAFRACSSITDLTIPNSVTSIGNSAFDDCSSITNLTIPNSVTSIGDSAFRDCSSITDLTIPSSVTEIGDGAFYFCSGLKSIKVDENNKKYDSRDNCNAIVSTEENKLLQGCTNTTIPNNIECIGYGAFAGSDINKIIIPDSVVQINVDAFNGCSELKELTLPCSVKMDDDYNGGTFDYVSQLEKVTFTKGTGKMSPCTDERPGWDSSFDCMYYMRTPWFRSTNRMTLDSNGNWISSPSTLSEIVLEEGIESIGDFVFCGCRIKNIVLPNSVNSLGNGSFKDCSDLENITIPNKVTDIGDSAFSGCSSLKNITIPDSVTSIGESAFSGCTSLKSIILPNNSNVTMGKNIFEGCNNLIDLYVANDKLSLMNVEIPNKVTIHCNYDSAAYWYAKQNGNSIVLLSEKPVEEITTEKVISTETRTQESVTSGVQESVTSGEKESVKESTEKSAKVTKPAKVKFSVRAGKKKASLRWKKVTAVKGYTVYYKTSKKGTWKKLKTVSNKKTSYTKKKLKSGKTYYFTVRAYKKVNGKKIYGKFTIKKIKVK